MKYFTPTRLIPLVVAGLMMTACGSETTEVAGDENPLAVIETSIDETSELVDETTEVVDEANEAVSQLADDVLDRADDVVEEASGQSANPQPAVPQPAVPQPAAVQPGAEQEPAPQAVDQSPAGDPVADDIPVDESAADDTSVEEIPAPVEDVAVEEVPAPVEEVPAPVEEPVEEVPAPVEEPVVDEVPYCIDNIYFSEKDDNCSRANYQNPPHADRLLGQLEALYGSSSKAKAVNDCLEQGGLPYYNADAPGGSKTGCTTNGAANYQPLGATDQRGTLLPFPDYDPTIGSADTPIECAYAAGQEIIQQAKFLTQGNSS